MFSKLSLVSNFSRLGGLSFGLLIFDLSVKNLLKRFAFATGSSITSPASLRGGIQAFLLVLVNIFKIEHFFLELIFGLFHIFLRVEKYLFFSALDCFL